MLMLEYHVVNPIAIASNISRRRTQRHASVLCAMLTLDSFAAFLHCQQEVRHFEIYANSTLKLFLSPTN